MEIRNIISPNYKSSKKRQTDLIKIVVIHYTGMQSERESIKRLCNPRSKVSSHYLINRRGKILRLVQDRHVAWHAGKSCWGRHKNLNENSIGIELVNKGHQIGYTSFKKNKYQV
jgi:N-acetylmuramoyl-L-alanine amidase